MHQIFVDKPAQDFHTDQSKQNSRKEDEFLEHEVNLLKFGRLTAIRPLGPVPQ
jgi:hypothetical protein